MFHVAFGIFSNFFWQRDFCDFRQYLINPTEENFPSMDMSSCLAFTFGDSTHIGTAKILEAKIIFANLIEKLEDRVAALQCRELLRK